MEVEAFLCNVPLFVDLSKSEMSALVQSVRIRTYQEGQVVFHKDDPGTGLFVISRGIVKITLNANNGQETLVALMGQGECFGELAVLDNHPRSATATALEQTEALFLPCDAFRRFLDGHPAVMMKIIILLSRRLRSTDEHLADLVFFDVLGRLAKKLTDLALKHGMPHEGGVRIDLPLTQQDLASLVGASRESVNKAIRYFHRQGYLTMRDHRITILRPDLLQQRAR